MRSPIFAFLTFASTLVAATVFPSRECAIDTVSCPFIRMMSRAEGTTDFTNSTEDFKAKANKAGFIAGGAFVFQNVGKEQFEQGIIPAGQVMNMCEYQGLHDKRSNGQIIQSDQVVKGIEALEGDMVDGQAIFDIARNHPDWSGHGPDHARTLKAELALTFCCSGGDPNTGKVKKANVVAVLTPPGTHTKCFVDVAFGFFVCADPAMKSWNSPESSSTTVSPLQPTTASPKDAVSIALHTGVDVSEAEIQKVVGNLSSAPVLPQDAVNNSLHTGGGGMPENKTQKVVGDLPSTPASPQDAVNNSLHTAGGVPENKIQEVVRDSKVAYLF